MALVSNLLRVGVETHDNRGDSRFGLYGGDRFRVRASCTRGIVECPSRGDRENGYSCSSRSPRLGHKTIPRVQLARTRNRSPPYSPNRESPLLSWVSTPTRSRFDTKAIP